MNILLLLIPLSLVLIGIAAWIFVWAVRHGQFEDLDTPALDVLRDEPPVGAEGAAGELAPDERAHSERAHGEAGHDGAG